MNPFLNSVGRQNVKLVKILASEDRYFSFEEISKELNVTPKTVKKMYLLFHLDIQNGIYPVEISRKPKKGIRLTGFSQFFLSEFERIQLGSSISYKIIEDVFYGEYKNAIYFSNKNFTSLSSFYKYLKEIRIMLEAFNVPKLVATRARIQKLEMNYRYFFFYYFWNIFKGEKWPFKNFDRNLIIRYVEKIENILCETYSIPEKEMLCYWIAVILSRLNIGCKLSANEKSEEKISFLKEMKVYGKLKKEIESFESIKKFSLNESERGGNKLFVSNFLWISQP